MTLSVKYLKEARFKEPMVMLSLSQYEALMEYIEDAEDIIAIRNRANEETISSSEFEKKFKRKFKAK